MRKTFASSGLLVMGVLVALAALGVVYGLWSKNLVINGTVHTGDLNADWDCGYVNDDGSDALVAGGAKDCILTPELTGSDTGADPKAGDADYAIPPGFVASDGPAKDVAECQLTLGPAAAEFGFQVGEVTIKNAYPSYECLIVLALSNTGSIPFNIAGIGADLGANTDGLELGHADAAGKWVEGCDFSQVAGAAPVQVDPGQEKQISCIVHVKQTAFQSVCTGTTTTPGGVVTVAEDCTPSSSLQTYHFALNACVAQWNEAADMTQCKTSLQHEGPGEVSPAPPSPNTGPNPPVVP